MNIILTSYTYFNTFISTLTFTNKTSVMYIKYPHFDLFANTSAITTQAHHNAIVRDDKRHADFCKALSLSISYGANIGGTASLTGTGPNLILSGIAYDYYLKYGMESPISYTSWMAFGVPGAIIGITLAWLWLQVNFIGFRLDIDLSSCI